MKPGTLLADTDRRIAEVIQAIMEIRRDNYTINIPTSPADELERLVVALQDLAHSLEKHSQELDKLDTITTYVNAGLLLDDVLDNVYESFRGIIPYNRIGLSLIENDGTLVRARWARTDQPVMKLTKGYSAKLEGSSLQQIIETGDPRIINDLENYYRNKPDSESTALILAEGIRSSLTCPLIANGVPIGFLFFSSIHPNAYHDVHSEIFQRIAAQLSVIVEKGRLVSALADQNEAIERQNKELRQLNNLKNTFLGMVAHDLRNPLANIQMAAQLLVEMIDELSTADHISFLNDIQRQSEYMLALINELLDVTQIETGRLDLNLEQVDLGHFLEDAAARHDRLAAIKGTHVVLKPVEPGYVTADPSRLRQIIDNLISNGVKYSPGGSVVTVWAEQTGEEWTVFVKDQGPGIKDEEREKLFQYFGRLSTLPTGGEKSTGLGLAITRRAVEAHGGWIGVDSIYGEGCTFRFTLPAAHEQ